MLNDFLQVVRSPWWSRARAVQECLLPKISLVIFGSWRVTWAYMVEAHQMKNNHGDVVGCCAEAVIAFNTPQIHQINERMWHPGRGQVYGDIVRGNRAPPSPMFR